MLLKPYQKGEPKDDKWFLLSYKIVEGIRYHAVLGVVAFLLPLSNHIKLQVAPSAK